MAYCVLRIAYCVFTQRVPDCVWRIVYSPIGKSRTPKNSPHPPTPSPNLGRGGANGQNFASIASSREASPLSHCWKKGAGGVRARLCDFFPLAKILCVFALRDLCFALSSYPERHTQSGTLWVNTEYAISNTKHNQNTPNGINKDTSRKRPHLPAPSPKISGGAKKTGKLHSPSSPPSPRIGRGGLGG